ncbi:methionine--tRNA ligase [Candidatus Fermentibacteria bacterium]|nr:methionine--tRNA ligase [Candidatus Fermentibacteria bacterium]
MARYLVTSALPYANGPLHLGHLAGVYLPGDIYTRFLRMRGEDVLYICGTDEHGVAITIAAERQGISPRDMVDEYHDVIRKDFEDFGISFDNFSRTTLPEHYELAQGVFLDLMEKGYITEKSEKQLYCDNCDRFLPDRYIEGSCPKCGAENARGDQCESCGSWLEALELKEARCSICGGSPRPRPTTHWYLKLDMFQEWLEGWLSRREGWRENVLNYCRGWLADGLRERAITRDLDWGVPVPLEEAEGKVLYVWFENLLGYVSSTAEYFEKKDDPIGWKRYWKDDRTRLIHFIGKDNIVFHAINFPCMLHALEDYVLTWNVPANEFLNFAGLKQSTSRGTAVWMRDYLRHFPPDPLRYALTINAPEHRDTDFTWDEFRVRNNELADVLGNFANRTLRFAKQRFEGRVPVASDPGSKETELLQKARRTANEMARLMESFRIKAACGKAMDLAREGNRYFDRARPWKTVKTDADRCGTSIHYCLQLLDSLRMAFSPFVPFTCDRLGEMLGRSSLDWKDIGELNLEEGDALGEPVILFQKLQEGFETNIYEQPEPEEEQKEMISIDQFNEIDLRVGLITDVQEVEGSDNLYRMSVDLGKESRQVVAGLRPYIPKEGLLDKKVVVVCNLEPVKLRGVVSEGMILASDGEGGIVLIEAGPDAVPGDKIR